MKKLTVAFAALVVFSDQVAPGRYQVGGRCGGGNFGSAKPKVKEALP
jgi:hypothetical protein